MILSRVVGPGFELTVCGSPSPEWLEWLRTTDAPLTAGQRAWRDGTFTSEAPKPTPVRRPRAPRTVDRVDTEEL